MYCCVLSGELESSILGSGVDSTVSIAQHYNSLVKIITIASKLQSHASIRTAPVDEIAIGMSAVQAAVRIFTEWFASGAFTLSKAAAKKEKNAVLQTLQGLLATQYKSQAHTYELIRRMQQQLQQLI